MSARPCQSQLPEMPAALSSLECDGCLLLRQLPELAHTGLSFLSISRCPLLDEIPELPAQTLEYLHAKSLPRVRRLSRTSGRLPHRRLHRRLKHHGPA